jgi:hypothetical protein
LQPGLNEYCNTSGGVEMVGGTDTNGSAMPSRSDALANVQGDNPLFSHQKPPTDPSAVNPMHTNNHQREVVLDGREGSTVGGAPHHMPAKQKSRFFGKTEHRPAKLLRSRDNSKRSKWKSQKPGTLAPLEIGTRVFARRSSKAVDWYEGEVSQVTEPGEGEQVYKVKFDHTGREETIKSRKMVSDKVWEGFCQNRCCNKREGEFVIGDLHLAGYKPKLQHTQACDFSHLRLGITLEGEVAFGCWICTTSLRSRKGHINIVRF